MMALAHGLPVLVVPLTRHADHELVGRAVDDAGAGTIVHKNSSAAQLAAGITATLGISPRRLDALFETLKANDGAATAAEAIERL